MQINGIAHIQLTVSDMRRSRPFYEKLLALFEMTPLYANDEFYYCVGGRTGLAIVQSRDSATEPFDQQRVGLHHLCFRLRQRDDVDTLFAFARDELHATIIRPPSESNEWAPGYYSLLFEDPDGIRIEANYVPGKGNLDANVTLPKDWGEQFVK